MKVVGVMSGTSLDGLDIALVEFGEHNQQIDFELVAATTVPYPAKLANLLDSSPQAGAVDLKRLDLALGTFIGENVLQFFNDQRWAPDLIASHGHTVFHAPSENITIQIGDGNTIKKLTNTPTVFDFRSLDVALGGQGAPLVPLGDEVLFGEFDVCLNLGGIANISFRHEGMRVAGDICGCNLVLNALSQRLGHSFDKGGQLAKNGSIIDQLVSDVNANRYFSEAFPKSLDKGEVLEMYGNVLNSNKPPEDLLNTMCEHIAIQLANTGKGRLLVTGGGAHNQYLMRRIDEHWQGEVVIPDDDLVDYKEAIVFALLGYLRTQGKINVLKSVTGASRDSSSGVII